MLMRQVMTAGSAFMATNVDDIVILTLLFARLPQRRFALPVVAGQVIGFTVLVLISLLGFLGRFAVPRPWVGLLGLLPILLGIQRWWERREAARLQPDADGHALGAVGLGQSGPLAELLGMASLTMANGSDNIGVYLPLFADAGRVELAITLVTFAAGLALLCGLAWGLTRAPTLAPLLERYGDPLVPVVLITLGVLILVDSDTLTIRPLGALVILAPVALLLTQLLLRPAATCGEDALPWPVRALPALSSLQWPPLSRSSQAREQPR